MASHGGKVVVPIDVKKKPRQQKLPLHNRWHPEIPPVAEVQTGEVFRVEMVDFSGGGITKEYTAHDIKYADTSIFPISTNQHSIDKNVNFGNIGKVVTPFVRS